ncbi:MAG: hypothetical protein LBB08_00410 [Rickettsiales bacterium]|jgi:hypothetical protein|nr:hypothetical protein [Rickettsiales bacterium]
MKFAALLFSALPLAACTMQTKHRGYIFPSDLEMQVAEIKTTAELEKKLGSPQARTIFGDSAWIYYGADENYRGPLPLSYGNKTALLAWSKNGKITGKKILRGDDFPHVWIDDGETPIPAAIELNALQELVNNVGRFTPAGLGQ